LSFSISSVSWRVVFERGMPPSLGLRRRIGETGRVCSSESSNSSNTSGEVVANLFSRGCDTGGVACRISRGDGVVLCCDLRIAWSRYSDVGATDRELARAIGDRVLSGVDGLWGVFRAGVRDEGEGDIFGIRISE
jgi:hypothetical protein